MDRLIDIFEGLKNTGIMTLVKSVTLSDKHMNRGIMFHKYNFSLPGRCEFCCMLISFTNSLDSDHSVGPDLDPSCLTL